MVSNCNYFWKYLKIKHLVGSYIMLYCYRCNPNFFMLLLQITKNEAN